MDLLSLPHVTQKRAEEEGLAKPELSLETDTEWPGSYPIPSRTEDSEE